MSKYIKKGTLEKKRKENNQKLYRWYVDFIFQNGRAPKMREAGDFLGVSRERARQLFNRLEKDGYLLRVNKKGRTGNNFVLSNEWTKKI
jgi:predicted transcriptional regulator of viral defense system